MKGQELLDQEGSGVLEVLGMDVVHQVVVTDREEARLVGQKLKKPRDYRVEKGS